LKFANITEGNIKLNSAGKKFAKADSEERKKIFAEHLLSNVHLASYIYKILHERSDKKAPRSRFQTHLEDYLMHEDSNRILKIIIAWGRYAEIFSYNDNTKMFSLENPTASNTYL
jgi:NitT/TauT family transport system ATP-binding protein